MRRNTVDKGLLTIHTKQRAVNRFNFHAPHVAIFKKNSYLNGAQITI